MIHWTFQVMELSLFQKEECNQNLFSRWYRSRRIMKKEQKRGNIYLLFYKDMMLSECAMTSRDRNIIQMEQLKHTQSISYDFNVVEVNFIYLVRMSCYDKVMNKRLNFFKQQCWPAYSKYYNHYSHYRLF